MCPFFISLERYKVCTGPDQVFFMLLGFSYLNFKIVGIRGKEHFELLIHELLPFGGFVSHFDIADLNQRR
jgi:hypothetical protein